MNVWDWSASPSYTHWLPLPTTLVNPWTLLAVFEFDQIPSPAGVLTIPHLYTHLPPPPRGTTTSLKILSTINLTTDSISNFPLISHLGNTKKCISDVRRQPKGAHWPVPWEWVRQGGLVLVMVQVEHLNGSLGNIIQPGIQFLWVGLLLLIHQVQIQPWYAQGPLIKVLKAKHTKNII